MFSMCQYLQRSLVSMTPEVDDLQKWKSIVLILLVIKLLF
jgi:hypothetical protein